MKKHKCKKCGRKTLVHKGCLCQMCANEGIEIIIPIERTDYVGIYHLLNPSAPIQYAGSPLDHTKESK